MPSGYRTVPVPTRAWRVADYLPPSKLVIIAALADGDWLVVDCGSDNLASRQAHRLREHHDLEATSVHSKLYFRDRRPDVFNMSI